MIRLILLIFSGAALFALAPCGRAAELSPSAQALARMKTASGFKVSLVAHEPNIRQPLTMTFDARGRLWVIQYLQYPNPAGLTAVKVDQYLRTTYDRRPEPPPRGPKGADRITICEDTNQDGVADKFTDFVTGLNLASGMALGYDKVFVVQPPYLLAYPDLNHDDVPDRDPDVLLTGFGMEDSHAFANSLQWGPDGWLYGAHGSTVTANIRGIEFQQGIWRWHPRTDQFELFAEGGGNTWGLDFDEEGNVIAGTNWGEQIALHQIQGGYYVKGFAKHGPLHNPYTFGYFEHIPYRGFRGGHVTCGGIVYQGGAFPAEFNGRYIAANLLANGVYWHNLEPDGSSWRGAFGGVLLSTDDETFRPIDCLTGPDGGLYVADWCDPRASHVDPLDTWDRTTGRIYRIAPENASPAPRLDLAKTSGADLVRMLGNRNNWYRREARRILIERRNSADAVALRKQFDESDGVRLLESFWTLHGMGYADNALLQRALTHASVPVRTWAVRFIGDAPSATAEVASALVSRSRSDNSAVVRSQLAATARRLPAALGMPVFRELLLRSDAGDPHIPMMLWWGLEARALEHRQLVKELFEQTAVWESPLVQQHILTRLARRYAAEGQPRDFDMCVELLRLAPGLKQVVRLLEGIELGLAGRNLDVAPPALQTWFQSAWPANSAQAAFIRLGVRLRHAESLAAALRRAQDRTVPDAERLPLIESLGQSGASEAAPALLSVARENGSLNLRKAALGSLQPFSGPEIADQLLAVYPQLPRELQATVRQVLSARPMWAGALVNAAAAGTVQPSDISLDTLRQWLRHDNAELRTKIEKVWGRVQESSDDKKKAVNELRLVLRPSGTVGRTAKGELAAGKKVFLESCGQCHTLFGEGGAVGPDLTGIDRRNLDYLLTHIVDPSAFIRPEYVSYELMTRDDQMISGLIVEQNGNTITMVDRNQVRHQIARTELRQLNESKVSLMPEGLLEALAPQQVLDLFSYLQK